MNAIRKLSLSTATVVMLSLPATVVSATALATTTTDVPVVTLDSDVADVNTSQVIDDAHQSGTDAPGSQFLTFGHQLAPATTSTPDATAVAAASQSTLVSTQAALPLPVSPLDDISLGGASSSRTTADIRGAPIATSNGTLSVQFTTSGSVPVFFSGAERTTDTDPSSSCALATVTLTGPLTRTFTASTGNGCKSVHPSTQQWAQSITLPAGSYSIDVDYATNVFDDVLNGDPTSAASTATTSLNLSFLPPTAHFTSSVSGSTADLNGGSTLVGAAGRPVVTWRWHFGDGSSAVTTQPRIHHTFPVSPSSAPTYQVRLQVVDSAHALSPVATVNVLGTATSLTVIKTSSRVRVAGLVAPNRQGRSVVVSLARKRSGSFHVLATHRPILTSRSRFATSFPRPAAGTCRVTVRYPGDAMHLASVSRRIVHC